MLSGKDLRKFRVMPNVSNKWWELGPRQVLESHSVRRKFVDRDDRKVIKNRHSP